VIHAQTLTGSAPISFDEINNGSDKKQCFMLNLTRFRGQNSFFASMRVFPIFNANMLRND